MTDPAAARILDALLVRLIEMQPAPVDFFQGDPDLMTEVIAYLMAAKRKQPDLELRSFKRMSELGVVT